MSGCWAKSGQYFHFGCVQHQKKGKEACDCRLVSKEKIEDFVLEKIKQNVLTDENIRQLVRLVNDEIKISCGLDAQQLTDIGQQIEQNQGRLSRLYAALESGKVDIEDLAPRIRELRTQQQELENRRNELLDKMSDESPRELNLETVEKYVSGLKELLRSSSFVEQKSFLRSFVKRIELSEPQVAIDYAVPLPISGSTTTREVLRIGKLGSPGRIRTYNQAVNSRPLYH
jgi:site-specific DNA recombinase